MNKPLKWATQHVNYIKKTSSRVQKKKVNNTTSAKVKKEIANNDPREEIKKLEKELAFTFDSIATLTVHFDSLHHAYTSSKAELDMTKNATRLCDKEKELLTAYDDLGLQVNHLERKIKKLEKRISDLHEETLVVSSPCSSDSSIYTQTTPNTTPILDLDFMFDDQQCYYNLNQNYNYNYYDDLLLQPMLFY